MSSNLPPEISAIWPQSAAPEPSPPSQSEILLSSSLAHVESLLRKRGLLTPENATIITDSRKGPPLFSFTHIKLKAEKRDIISLSFDRDLIFIAPAGKRDLADFIADTYLSYMRIPAHHRASFDISSYAPFDKKDVSIVQSGEQKPMWKIKLLSELGRAPDFSSQAKTVEQMANDHRVHHMGLHENETGSAFADPAPMIKYG